MKNIQVKTELNDDIKNLENKIKDLEKKLRILEVQKKSYAEIAFQYGKQLNKTIGETKFLEMVKELSVVKGKHNPIHETNVEYSKELEDEVTEYLSNKKYEFQNEFLPLFLSGKITLIGDKEYMYWFEAIDDWLSLAKSGNEEAKRNLAICFNCGYGLEKNKDYENYLEQSIINKDMVEPQFEEYFEIEKPERLQEKNEKIKTFNVDPNKKEINFFETNEYKDLISLSEDLYKQATQVQTIYIKSIPSVDKLMKLAKKYEFLPYDIRNDLFGATILMHTSQVDFYTDNIKEFGSFIKKEKRCDGYIKLSNNSEWNINLAVSIKDNKGNTFTGRCRVNPWSNSQIAIFKQHLVGSKIDTVIFKTLDKNPKTFVFNPKNWVL